MNLILQRRSKLRYSIGARAAAARGSFIPPKPQRLLRELVRHRTNVVERRQAAAQPHAGGQQRSEAGAGGSGARSGAQAGFVLRGAIQAIGGAAGQEACEGGGGPFDSGDGVSHDGARQPLSRLGWGITMTDGILRLAVETGSCNGLEPRAGENNPGVRELRDYHALGFIPFRVCFCTVAAVYDRRNHS